MAGDYSLTEITEGTFVNKTHFALTFVCKSCLLKDGSTINPEEDNAILGWATSGKCPRRSIKIEMDADVAASYTTGREGKPCFPIALP